MTYFGIEGANSRRIEVDEGLAPGAKTDGVEENLHLKRQVAELRRANEVLKAASVSFAKALDQPTTR
ncbi:hypothetical protein [Aeromicrobium endophyticum]|uniref:hypothetical protein n=1 Tax=Aeromicrobium endophyticum TaxID=2292704 RepID=UPI0011C3D3AE|nr:hypothetical protein [Aeromicrobium endophyticum]